MSVGPAKSYARVSQMVGTIMATKLEENDPSQVAYLIARSALLEVRTRKGSQGAAELAYRLADEFAGEGQ